MTLQSRYLHLCHEFLSVTQPHVDDDVLKNLKEYYAKDIDSVRKLSYIEDLETLLKVLEKRDILSYDKIEPLSYISKQFLHDSHFEHQLVDYKDHLQTTQDPILYDMYQNVIEPADNDKTEVTNPITNCKCESVTCTAQTSKSQCEHHTMKTSSHFEQELKLQQMVLSQISERLGRSWRDVARHLGILEYQIDAIQNKYPFDLKEQSYEALKCYISQCDSSSWKLDLMHALENGRRRDLREIVEELTFRKRCG